MTARKSVERMGVVGLEKDHGLVRGHVELAAAAGADDVVVHADQVVAQLPEHRAVALVGAGWNPILLRTADPSHLVFVAMAALRTGEGGWLRLGALVEEIPLVQGHGPHHTLDFERWRSAERSRLRRSCAPVPWRRSPPEPRARGCPTRPRAPSSASRPPTCGATWSA